MKKVCLLISCFFQFSDIWSFSFFRTATNFPVSKKKKNPCGKTEPFRSHKVKQCAHMRSTGTCVSSRCRWREEPAVSVHGEQNGMAKKNSNRKGGDQNCRGDFILFWHLVQTSALREGDWQHESLACWASLADGEDLFGWKWQHSAVFTPAKSLRPGFVTCFGLI